MMVRRASLVVLAVVLSGCGLFSRAKSTFYSLETLPDEPPVTAVAGAPIGLDAIELPPGLDRREIVVRQSGHELDVRGTHQWSGPLEDMVIHTLAFDLARRLPDGMVVLPGQAKPAGAMRSLQIVFEDLAAGPENVFVLDARWTLSPGLTGRERVMVTMQSLESAAIAAAMSEALGTLSDRLVARIAAAAPS